MLGDNNIWRERFNPPSLEKEKWLQPAPKVFDAIEQELFPDQKKKKRGLYWYILAGLVLASLAVLMIRQFSGNNTKISQLDLNQEKGDRKELRQKATVQSDIPPVSSATSSNTASIENSVTSSSSSSVSSLRSENKTVSNKTAISNSSSSNVSFTKENQLGTIVSNSQNSLSGNSASYSVNERSPIIASKGKDETIKVAKLEPLEYFTKLSTLDIRTIFPLSNDNYLNADKIDFEPFVDPIEERKKRQAISLAFGYARTDYFLNPNFASAVDPADFTKSSAAGNFIDLSYTINTGKKLSYFVNVSLERSTFSSGHNSNYFYDPVNEINSQQQVNLMMATPMGFVDGSMVLQRSSTQSGQTDLTLDLNNRHEYKQVNLLVGLEYQIFKYKNFNTSLKGLAGMQQLFELKNILERVDVSDPNFVSSQLAITNEQANLNKTLTLAGLGISFEQLLNEDYATGISYNFLTSFTPIFKSGDLSTDLNKHMISLYLKKNF